MPVEAEINLEFLAGEINKCRKDIGGMRTQRPIYRPVAVAGIVAASPTVLVCPNPVPPGRFFEITGYAAYTLNAATGLPDLHTTVVTTGTQVVTPGVVPASGVAQQNTNSQTATVVLSGGTVTNVVVNGFSVGTGDGTYIVPSGGSISVTWSVQPTWVWTVPTSTPAIVDYYAGPSVGLDSPGDASSSIGTGPVGATTWIGDKKPFATAGDKLYAWVYGITTATQILIRFGVFDWKIEDRVEMSI